jgi:hypothetical protein
VTITFHCHAHLRQEHRAELARPDQRDPQRPVLRLTLLQQAMQVHPRLRCCAQRESAAI